MNLSALFPGSIWLYLGAAVGIAAISGGATYAVKDTFDQNTIKDLKLEAKDKQLEDAKNTLSQFKADTDRIHGSASEYAALLPQFRSEFAGTKRDFENAIKSRPLPAGCVLDDGRLRPLSAAVAAANRAASGHISLPAVSATP